MLFGLLIYIQIGAKSLVTGNFVNFLKVGVKKVGDKFYLDLQNSFDIC